MGKKRALIVGLNYPNQSNFLRDSVNDSIRVKDMLITYYGFAPNAVKLVVDAKGTMNTPPLNDFRIKKTTKQINDEYICKKLTKMIKKSSAGDTIFFYFAGHGGSTTTTFDNDTGCEEYMRCHGGTMIEDSAIRHLWQTVPEGCSFTFVADCCKSGGLLEGAKEIVGNSKIGSTVSEKGLKPWNKVCKLGRPTNHPLGIFISSCQANEDCRGGFCAERLEHSSFFSQAFLRVIEETRGNVTNLKLVQRITKLLENRPIQTTPGLYCDDNQMNLMFLGSP